MTANVAETGVAAQELTQFVERVERLEEEKKAISGDIREVYAGMKGCGFDVWAVREIVNIEAGPFRTQGNEGRSRTLHGGLEYDVGAVRELLLQSLGRYPNSLPPSRGKARRRDRKRAWGDPSTVFKPGRLFDGEEMYNYCWTARLGRLTRRAIQDRARERGSDHDVRQQGRQTRRAGLPTGGEFRRTSRGRTRPRIISPFLARARSPRRSDR